MITVASQDPQIAGVIAQIPFNGFPKRPANRSRSTRQVYALLWAAIRDRVRGWFGRAPLYVKAVGSAEERAIMTGDDAVRTIEALKNGIWHKKVAPRGVLDMMAYKPGIRVAHVQAPLMVCIGELDRETQGATTEPLARDAPRGELHSYPVTHFDIYRPDVRERVIADQIDFLRRAFAKET